MNTRHQFPVRVNQINHYYLIYYSYSRMDWTMFTQSSIKIAKIIDNIIVYQAIYNQTSNDDSYDSFIKNSKGKITIYDATDNTYQYGKKLSTYEMYELWLKYRNQTEDTSPILISYGHARYPKSHRTTLWHTSGIRIAKRHLLQNEWHFSKLPVRHRNRKIVERDEEACHRSTGWKSIKKRHQWE